MTIWLLRLTLSRWQHRGDRCAFNDGNGSSQVTCAVYQYINSSWQQLGTDIDGEAQYDYLATPSHSQPMAAPWRSVPFNDGNGSDSGHVRIYQYINSSWVS